MKPKIPLRSPESAEGKCFTRKCEEEKSNLRELLKKRDSEVDRLKREIHKLKVGEVVIVAGN